MEQSLVVLKEEIRLSKTQIYPAPSRVTNNYHWHSNRRNKWLIRLHWLLDTCIAQCVCNPRLRWRACSLSGRVSSWWCSAQSSAAGPWGSNRWWLACRRGKLHKWAGQTLQSRWLEIQRRMELFLAVLKNTQTLFPTSKNIPSALSCDSEITIDIQLCSMSHWTGRICGPACIFPNVGVVHVGDDQHAGPGANHSGCDTWPRVEILSLEAPCDGDRHVSLWDDTSQLCKFSRVNNFSAKWERNYARRF